MEDVLNFTNSELTSRARLISGGMSEPIVAENELASTFEVRCRNFLEKNQYREKEIQSHFKIP